MDEDNIFVPLEWLTRRQQLEESVAGCPKDKTSLISNSGGQRNSPAPPGYPASPPPSHTQPNPEYYNLCGPPPSPPPGKKDHVASCHSGERISQTSPVFPASPPPGDGQPNPEYYNLCGPPPSPPPRKKDHVASCPKNTTSSVSRGEGISQTSPVFPASPGDREPSPEYCNVGEIPPSPPPRRLPSGDSHSRREPVPPPPRRSSAPVRSGFNGLPPTDTSNSTDKPPLPPSRNGPGKKCHSTDEPPTPLPRHSSRRSDSADYLSTPGPPPPPPHNRKLAIPVHAGQHSLLALPSPPPPTRRSASVDWHSKRELPPLPPFDNEYTTLEQNSTDRRLRYQSPPKRHSTVFSGDTHQPLQAATRRKTSNSTLENLQPLTPPTPTSPQTPTSIRSQFIPTSCTMTFEEVADPQKVTLPQLFMANTTYTCGVSSIAEGSILLVKYTKSTSMVHGQEQDGTKIQMSLNTPATLSPITDESNQRRHMSAEELLTCKPHPVAVKVMQSFKQRDFTVERGTLLFLQTTGTAAAKGKPRKLIFQDYRGNRVVLTAICPGIFSSHPDDVKLFLAELVAKCAFPLNVLFEDGIYSTNIVTLDRVRQQDVLVAQLCNKRDGQPVGQDHELPNHSGLSLIRVALKVNDKMSERAVHTTIFELEAANASQLPDHTGRTMPGVEKNDTDAYLETHEYVKMLRGRNHGVASPSSEQQPLRNDESSHSGRLDTFAKQQTRAERPIDEGQPRKGDSERRTISDDDDSDEDEEYLYVSGDINQVKYTAEERNIAYLKTLNEADILQLLDAMNMEVYKPTFQREAVDGHLLSELTDQMLINDLGIQSALHCLRLGTVIKGNRSAKELLASRLASN